MTVTPSGLHTMTTGLHEGMLTLAGFCIILIVVAKFYRRFFSNILYVNVEAIISYLEPASVIGALGGSIFLVVSAYVGFMVTGGINTLVDSPLLMNKVMMAIFAEELWIIFIVIRFKYGKEVWSHNALSTVYAIIGLSAWLFVVETGSLGGHLAGKGSVLDPIYEILGINPEQFFYLGALGIYSLIGISILAFAIFVYIYEKEFDAAPEIVEKTDEKIVYRIHNCVFLGGLKMPEKICDIIHEGFNEGVSEATGKKMKITRLTCMGKGDTYCEYVCKLLPNKRCISK